MKKIVILTMSIIVFTATLSVLTAAAELKHTVSTGESLYLISKRYNVSIDDLKDLNGLTSDTIYPDQKLTVINGITGRNYLKYTVSKDDTAGRIAERFGVNIASITAINPNFDSNAIYEGQKLNILADFAEYTVKSGDTLSSVAAAYNTTINQIKLFNDTASDYLMIGQIIKIPVHESTPLPPAAVPASVTAPSASYRAYLVRPNDTAWNIAIMHGIPVTELLHFNDMQADDMLKFGEAIKVPVHYIPVKETPGAEYGEHLDWWTEAQYVFSTDKVATVIDFETKKNFKIQRTIGVNHADCEPLTKTDTETAKSIWGGFSWSVRPVLVEVNGRKIAAAMSFQSHDLQYLTNNDFDGHFDLFFLNSTRHKDGAIDLDYQEKTKIAAGVK